MTLRTLSSTAAAAVLALGLAACGSDGGETTDSGAALIKAGTLTVCSDVPYPPFEDFDKNSETGFKGFDIDIVSEVAERLDLEIEIKDSSFDALQSGLALNSGQCDLAASAMTINDDRKKNLDFSDGYYDSAQSLLVPAGSKITGIDDLDGVKVGVQQGTTGKDYAEENAKGAELITFPSDAEMFAAIKAGQVDALLQDLPVNLDHVKAGGYEIVEEYSTEEEYGLAMKKGNTALVEDVNGALEEMRDDGAYDELYDKYFAVK
ncbi:ABC transporter substrate-binding protein [Nocardioides sp.]|uniref:ABC transporter substrate-binding protein n=1 Tax=Nocardioides sp. TaxID=35761 RepID=UPI002B622AB7|nr:ABC transporter substrate-binding protein [Nocardioides sp.]HSX68083.1 ABC transporter substrate-binding protein [Nocardioides sp.]